MSNRLLIKKSSVATKVPVAEDLEYGELAINYTDEKIYFKNASNLIKSFSSGSGTVTSVAALTLGTSGTDVTSTVATGTTTPVITLNIPTASATNRGALSAADWTTFNNKVGSLTDTLSTVTARGATTATASTFSGGLTASKGLTVSGGYTYLGSYNTDGTSYPSFGGTTVAVAWNFTSGNAEMNIWNTVNPTTYGSTGFRFMQQTAAATYRDLMFLRQDGNVGIGTTAPAYKLDVTGTMGVTGVATVGSLTIADSQDSIVADSSISSWVYEKDFSVAAQESEPRDLAFGSNGTKMYILGNTGNDINEYTLSTAWDISTAVYVQLFSIAAQDTTPLGLYFKPDGTKFYMCGGTVDTVYEYNVSTAWNISTSSFLQSFSVTAKETEPNAVAFSSDGTKMYVTGTTSDAVHQYNLSTAWSIASAAFSTTLSVSAYTLSAQGLDFDSTGTKMYLVGSTYNRIIEFTLSTPWALSTAIYSGVVSAVLLGPYLTNGLSGIHVELAQNKAYITDYATDRVFQLSTDIAATKLDSSKFLVEGDVHLKNDLLVYNNLYSDNTIYARSNIISYGNATVAGTLDVRGAIDLADADILRLGTGDDWEFFHDGINNYMDLNVGNLIIRDNVTNRFTFDRTTGNLTGTGNLDFSKFLGLPTDLVTTPSFTWTGDLTTGLYRPAVSQVGIAIAGVQGAVFSTTGLAVTGTITGTSFNSITALSSTAPAALGTAAIGTSTTVARSDHVHTAPTSLTGVTSIGFAAEASDAASISTTITGSSTFFDFNLTDDNYNDEWRWRFTPSGTIVYNAMRLVPVSNTAANLVVSGTVSASGTTLTGNTGTVTSVATSGGYGGLTLTGGTITTTGTITMGGTPTGTWPISVGGSSSTTPLVSVDNSIAYGRSGLQYVNVSGLAGDVANTTNTPNAEWWHIIRGNHGNASGYYTDLALPMTAANNIRYRRIAAGTSSGWITVWDSTNLTNLNQLTNGPGYGTGTVTAVTATTPIASSGGTTPNITHATSGVGAGTYNNVTVNTFGHVTAGSNVGYISGYTEVDTLATVTARGNVASASITVPQGNGNGYGFWGGTASYLIAMSNAADHIYGPVTDYSIKLTMSSGAGRGITFGQTGVAPVAAINTTSGNMTIAGTFSALSKSFLIDHPTKPGMQLRYGSLESPYHGVRLTGVASVINGECVVQLPDYICGLVHSRDAQVQLTNFKHGKVLWVDDIVIDENYFVVKTDLNIDDPAEYKFFWSFTGVRKDINDMIVECEK